VFSDSEMDSSILELCSQYGPSDNTFHRISQTFKCCSPDEVCLTFPCQFVNHVDAMLKVCSHQIFFT